MHLVRNILLAFLCILPFIGMTPADAANSRKIYFYLSRNKQWCGIENLKVFQNKNSSSDASESDVDQGIIAISDRVIWIEEYRTNEDAEWTILTHYNVEPNGTISSARVSLQTDEYKRVSSYKVANGIYVAQHRKKNFNIKFRKAASLSDFPFYKLVLAAQKNSQNLNICTS